jgi:hypothetical protein
MKSDIFSPDSTVTKILAEGIKFCYIPTVAVRGIVIHLVYFGYEVEFLDSFWGEEIEEHGKVNFN